MTMPPRGIGAPFFLPELAGIDDLPEAFAA
jgi:hypothetical protein